MSEVLKWKVRRRHQGDRMYERGDIREGTKAELGHLVPGLLEAITVAEKPARRRAEPKLKNKAEAAAPANKADQGQGRKKS